MTVRVNHGPCSYCAAENGSVGVCRDIQIIISPFLLVNQRCCTLGVRICLAENKLLVKWIWQMHICRCSWKMNHDISWQQTNQNVCFATFFPFGYCISNIYSICMCLYINQLCSNKEIFFAFHIRTQQYCNNILVTRKIVKTSEIIE